MTFLVPMVDPTIWHKTIQEELEHAAMKVLRSGRFVLGSELNNFERKSADYLGCQYAVGCASGTDALVLALRALGIKTGDEVITTPFSFFATAEAIASVGAKPVFVDIDSYNFNIDTSLIESAISSKTKAILVVHLFGNPANLESLSNICEKNGLYLIEDCAQSFGAEYKKKKTGTIGNIGCFSFFPSKNLGGFGDGGLLTTNSTLLADKLKQLRNHGSRIQYHHDILGYNSRLDEIQAALLTVKLDYLDDYNNQRKEIVGWYREYLNDSPFVLPDESKDCTHVYNQYTVLTPGKRDTIQNHLERHGIASSVFYPVPLYRQKAFKCDSQKRDSDIQGLPTCEHVSKLCLSLPIYPGMSHTQTQLVAKTLIEAVD